MPTPPADPPSPRSGSDAGGRPDPAALPLADRIRLVGGADLWHTAAQPALGLPRLRLSDGPAGVRGTSFTGHTSASFPCPTALAASFDVALVEEVAGAIGDEAVTKGASMLLAPTVNLHRTPIGGRNFECFSEDPALTTAMGVAYVRGVQSRRVGACIKHFVANDTETERMTVSSEVTERVLREVYLAPFEAAVGQAGVRAVMSAYNRLNGTYCAEHGWLLDEVLKGEWGFEGLVVSDWFGTKSTAASARAGLDLEMPGPPRYFGDRLGAAVAAGEVEESVVDDKVRRLVAFAAWAGRLGASEELAERTEEQPLHRALIRRAAAAGTVLLANDGLLPLSPERLRRLALIGPGISSLSIQGGGSAQVVPHRVVTPLDAFREALPGVELVHEPGCVIDRGVPAATGAFTIAYLDMSGEGSAAPATDDEVGRVVGEATARALRLTWLGPPGHGVEGEEWGVRAEGTLSASRDGVHTLTLTSAGWARLFLDGQLVADTWKTWAPGPSYFGAGSAEATVEVDLPAGTEHRLTVVFRARPGRSPVAGVTVGHRQPQPGDLFERAVAAAGAADVCVVVAGTNGDWESEGSDRVAMDLPGRQDELIAAVAAANPRTAVVLNAGSPVSMPWAEQVAAVLQCWFPGQEGGDAIADVVLGRSDPGGRLPVSVPYRLADTPAYVSHPPLDGRALYGEGLFVGHRWYDARGIEPRFPFGFGLSYATFAWGQPTVSLGDGAAVITVAVTNTSERVGREVVQVYVSVPAAEVRCPLRVLGGFGAVELGPGQTADVAVAVPARAWSWWSGSEKGWRLHPGPVVLHVARSSRHLVDAVEIDPSGGGAEAASAG